MKYQALKRLKTKSKLLKLCDSLQEADEVIKKDGGIFREFSYIGGYPTYINALNDKVYQIQGYHEKLGIVLGIDNDELSKFNFSPVATV